MSVSLPDEDIEFLDDYAASNGMASRSAAVHKPVRLERLGGLGSWVGFLVADVDAVYESVKGIGVDPPRTRDHRVREISVTDPEGHTWGFVQRRD